MKYSVVLYCPDQHLEYNIHTLDYHGVGGGVTARIRMAHALVELGHKVTLCINCPKDEAIEGVEYRHHNRVEKVNTEIFIASTSGDGCDLSKLYSVDIHAKLAILMSHGIEPPNGMDGLEIDYIYAPSNFVRALAEKKWGIDSGKLFVTHRGVRGQNFKQAKEQPIKRDPYSLFYAGHPQKGLETALNVLHLLRQNDPRFSLHIFGGYGLWGDEETKTVEGPGVFYHGLIGQFELAQRMQALGFCINLQSMEDTFGMVNIEAMRAGCIVIASEVGAYPEVIQHGDNGFIIRGEPMEASTHAEAAEIIMELVNDQERSNAIREKAIAFPLDWNTIAKAWVEHWNWALSGRPSSSQDLEGYCPLCGGNWLPLADGYHCIHCGYYQRHVSG